MNNLVNLFEDYALDVLTERFKEVEITRSGISKQGDNYYYTITAYLENKFCAGSALSQNKAVDALVACLSDYHNGENVELK